MTATATEYPLGYQEAEFARLMRQARFLDEMSEPLLRQAGIQPGMRVLDVGCGAGDVSFLLSRLLGSTDPVLGIDRSPESVDLARRRARAAGISTLRFEVADLDDLPGTETFDAVVGRLVLMYLPDVPASLASLARRVRPGGIITFQEYDIDAMTAVSVGPRASLADLTFQRVKDTFRRVGAEIQMGPKLAADFVAAGLPHATVRIQGRMESDPDDETLDQLVGITRTLLPPMAATGVATATEVDIDTLHARLRAEMVATGSGMRPPPLYGAWSRLPA